MVAIEERHGDIAPEHPKVVNGCRRRIRDAVLVIPDRTREIGDVTGELIAIAVSVAEVVAVADGVGRGRRAGDRLLQIPNAPIDGFDALRLARDGNRYLEGSTAQADANILQGIEPL